MYVDKKKKRWPMFAWAVAGALAAICLWCVAVPASGEDMSEESAKAVKEAVDRCALQCYVVEGAYPVSLEYLEENYGLQINDQMFYVSYEIFATNVPPAVKVIRRE